MALNVGSRLGHYAVTALIGEGGMGQVYQATDTKLNRQAALKILPEAFATDPDRLARFQREAQVLASLNHPGIAAIYGIEEAEGTRALVLELVEGPTLADRIAKGPIPLDEALPIAKQIAEAVEAAHEAGVIHRDLKPANIKVREDGTVKVLDFGLAKALDPNPTGDPSQSPTLTAAATQMGVIMGTAAYMSPEQARGKTVDKRADIWAFGVVLFEMLTGKKAFEGEDVSLTLSAVLQREPDWDALPGGVSPVLNSYLRRCVEKDPRQRIRDVGDVRLAMGGALDVAAATAAEPGSGMVHIRRAALGATASAVLAGVVVAVAAWYALAPGDPAPGSVNRFSIDLPAGAQLYPDAAVPLAISHDGRRLVFIATIGGVNQIYVRSLKDLTAVPVRGPAGSAESVFLSPDGEWLGFNDGGTLKRVRVTGGTPTTICDLPDGFQGLSWASDGRIVFATIMSPHLMQVPEVGGEPEPFTSAGDGERHIYPHFLPDERALLFTIRRAGEPDWIAVFDVESRETQMLLAGTGPKVTASGHLLFARAGALWAVGLDIDRLELLGVAAPVPDPVAVGYQGLPQLSVSDNGLLFYEASTDRRVLVWVDREGREQPIPGIPPNNYEQVRVSPDGTRLATGGPGDIGIYDIGRETFTPLTTDPAEDLFPLWSVDGERIVFESNREGRLGVFSVRADGTGQAERLATGDIGDTIFAPEGRSPDGSTLLLTKTPGDVLALDETGGVEVLFGAAEPEFDAAVSPDGRWVAYSSFVAGRPEVYVQRYPDLGNRSQISVGGGLAPRWSVDSTELFYMNSVGRLYAVSVDSEATDPWGVPEPLFEGSYLTAATARFFDVAPDGRFVVIKQGLDSGAEAPDLVVVENWFEELKRLVPVD